MKSQKGMTLVELLASISLLSIVLLLAFSINLFGQKQTADQSAEIQNQSNVELALNMITKEIRKASTVSVDTNNVLTLNGTDVIKLQNNSIKKNDEILIHNIQTFSVTKSNDKITLSIGSVPSDDIPTTTMSVVIYLRN